MPRDSMQEELQRHVSCSSLAVAGGFQRPQSGSAQLQPRLGTPSDFGCIEEANFEFYSALVN